MVLLVALGATVIGAGPAGARTNQAGPPELDPLSPLTLVNDWTTTVYGTAPPAAGVVDGAVVFRGAVMSGTSGQITTLPVGMRPTTTVYLPADLCGGVRGRLIVNNLGQVFVSADDFGDAQCFTSLDGRSFTLGAATRLTLRNGWVNGEYGTRPAKARVLSGTVRLSGAISLGTRATAFQLPVGMRPNRPTYVAIDLCNGAVGRLLVLPTGKVKVQSATDFAAASCFASLEGATFRLSAPNPLATLNGWSSAAFGTRAAKAAVSGPTVHLVGGLNGGSDSLVTVLPEGLRPSSTVYVVTNLCGAAPGRLIIDPNGEVRTASPVTFTDAQCFTSLDGVSFTP
ncbi:MAG: hypothetical protein JNK12_10745 [Acidimicrobiales bacterium]|nr:hypothetical protein [Acidimicrobiales bacterium]